MSNRQMSTRKVRPASDFPKSPHGALMLVLLLAACSAPNSMTPSPQGSSSSVVLKPAKLPFVGFALRTILDKGSVKPKVVEVPVATQLPATMTPPQGVANIVNVAPQFPNVGIRPAQQFPPGARRAHQRRLNGRVTPGSIVQTPDGSGTEGFAVNPQFDDVEAVLTSYGSNQVSIPPPNSPSFGVNEIATTIHGGYSPPDGTTNCLEAATLYYTPYGDVTHAVLAIGDWCSQRGTELFPVLANMDDSSFVSNYVRNINNTGNPSVQVEVYQPVNGDGRWRAIIANFNTNQWDNLYTVGGDAGYDENLHQSWDVIESHYDTGPCAQIPTMASFNFQGNVENGQNHFRLILPSDLNPAGPGNPNGEACFSDDGSGLGYVYTFMVTTPSSAYVVTDPKPARGPLDVWPSKIAYPQEGNNLTHCAVNQPAVPNDPNDVDPYPMRGLRFSTDANGCELLDGKPVDQVSTPSVHIREWDYAGKFQVSPSGCGGYLSQAVLKRQGQDPNVLVTMHGTASIPKSVSCSADIKDDQNSKTIGITLYPGW